MMGLMGERMQVKRQYLIKIFKSVAGTREYYGSKTFVDTLDRAHERLVQKFGDGATVQVLGPGRYSIANGAAELEVRR